MFERLKSVQPQVNQYNKYNDLIGLLVLSYNGKRANIKPPSNIIALQALVLRKHDLGKHSIPERRRITH
ncbi:MAG: hypothetical protein JWR02_448 [Mucilaginibacter sp.]|nr:hypothetical protein [Mucilaginibacter sp.]